MIKHVITILYMCNIYVITNKPIISIKGYSIFHIKCMKVKLYGQFSIQNDEIWQKSLTLRDYWGELVPFNVYSGYGPVFW